MSTSTPVLVRNVSDVCASNNTLHHTTLYSIEHYSTLLYEQIVLNSQKPPSDTSRKGREEVTREVKRPGWDQYYRYVMVRDGAWWHVMEYVLLPLLLLLLLLLLQLLLLLTVL